MQVITDFLCEAWRTLTDSFVLKALHVFPLRNYHT
uniref:Uncharacterized protein n=1 Tax=Myoviridae sp. ctv1i11 TaxID=2826709 RepID=A0A8S5MUK9_9CAUD|nr:MAG TPA: hypothetical protein [Myoviridae sp. ctv1i11]